MNTDTLFQQKPDSHPKIYAYYEHDPTILKVGWTNKDVKERVEAQHPTKSPAEVNPYTIVLEESAMRSDGTSFTDYEVHAVLEEMGIHALRAKDNRKTEWFKCSKDKVKEAIIAVRHRKTNFENRTLDFKMRPEQEQAVEKTIIYFKSFKQENFNRPPKFLWNAKMRFGKTFTAYQLAKKMEFKRVLILTFKPAVKTAWKEDLLSHIDFEGWQFISKYELLSPDEQYQNADKSKPIVCFGSFQDFLGVDANGGIKPTNKWVHKTDWDLVIFDEYHFGAWKDSAQNLFKQNEENFYDMESDISEAYDESWLPITSDHYLYLSGTPFRALKSGEFIEDQIYNWTYSDEQNAKKSHDGNNNPYKALPQIIMMTYKLPDSIQQIAIQGEFDEFDLNVFFLAEGNDNNAKFVHEEYVQKWLDLIRGSYLETSVDDLKLGSEKPPMPYSDISLLNSLSHTLWFLPNVASCYAMKNLLEKNQNTFYQNYTINVCAGTQAGVGVEALDKVMRSMEDPLNTKTITLSCGKLTTGVTIKPWTGIFMLRNLQSPETYFQAAFRVQSPWEITLEDGKKEIMKPVCYIFDFALNRALKLISDYSRQLNINENNPEKCVNEFISFLPVLAYEGSAMRRVNAADILDIGLSGTTATLLARRWESSLLVNVDNNTLARLFANENAMNALMKIEGFRNLNQDIEIIINKSESVKKTKKSNKTLTKKEKKELTDKEKEYKSKRDLIREKLIKFATRIPIFLYLTDCRENSLKDIITQLEPELFKKVTGLNIKDFELLVSLNLFNESLMNDAVYKFKRYEDASLAYTGINKHEEDNIGLYSTVISREEYNKLSKQLYTSQNL